MIKTNPTNQNTNYSYIALRRTDGTPANKEHSKPATQEPPQILLHGMRNIGNDDVLLASFGENQQTQTTQIRSYIEKNKITMADALSKSIKNAQFVFVGESHIEGLVAWKDVINSFSKLKEEAEARGEKLIVAVEIGTTSQNAAANSPIDAVEKLVASDPKDPFYARWKVLLGARRAGLQIECIDPGIPGFDFTNDDKKVPTTEEFNKRDKIMFDNFEKLAKPKVKILYYGGGFHGSIIPVKGYPDNKSSEKFITVATHLTQKYGSGSVTSFGMVNRDMGFDGDPQIVSKTPKVTDVWPLENGITVVPVGGPVTYSNRSQHHYVIIDSSPEPKK